MNQNSRHQNCVYGNYTDRTIYRFPHLSSLYDAATLLAQCLATQFSGGRSYCNPRADARRRHALKANAID